MPRPSRNIDKLLIKTGLEMLPETGVTHMNVREVVQRAQVNLGMFHYHFKTKDAFVRIILQEIYEQMFASIVHVLDDQASAIDNLRRVLTTLARFARDNRRTLLSMILDLKSNEPLTLEFVSANFPRHLLLIRQLVEKGQKEGQIVPLPVPMITAFIAGGVAMPSLIGGTITDLHLEHIALIKPMVEAAILSDEAIDQRIRMALKGVSP